MKNKYKVTIIAAVIAATATIISALVSQSIHITIKLPQTNITSSNTSDSTSGTLSSTYTESTNSSTTDTSTDVSISEPNHTSTSPLGEHVPDELILHADNQDGKWGYVDQFGNERIPHVYDWADDFVEDYAAVFKNYSWEFIDKSGTVVIPFKYNGAWSFTNGLAPVFNGDKWGFIDKNGNVKIPFKFKDIICIHEDSGRVYADEDDNIINYAVEINNSLMPSSTKPDFSGNPTESTNGNVPIRDFLQQYVSATLNGSILNISVMNEQAEELNEEKAFPFQWGLHLTDSFGNNLVGEYIIELELCIDSDNTVIDTNATVYIEKDNNQMEQVQKNITEIDAYFDGDNFVISCDITNDYIRPEDICINTVFCN